MAGVFCRRIIASTSTDHWVYYRYWVSDAIYRFRVENVCVLHLRTSCIVFNRELARDVTDVDKISDALISQFQNPFDLETVPSALVNIVTGHIASKTAEESLTTLQETGRQKIDAICRATACAEQHLQEFWGCSGKGADANIC